MYIRSTLGQAWSSVHNVDRAGSVPDYGTHYSWNSWISVDEIRDTH